MHKQNILKALLFVGSLLALSFVAECTFDFLIKKNYDFKPSYVASGQINADVLIHGPSRAIYHVNPQIVQNVTGHSTYNIGMNASSIKEQLLILQLYLNHNKRPKLIALEVHRGYINEDVNLIFHGVNYVPFMDEEEVVAMLKKEDKKLYRLSKFPFLKYALYSSSILNEVIKGIPQLWKGPKEYNFQNGFQAKDKKWNEAIEVTYRPEKLEVSEDLLNYYQKFIALAKKNNIKVVLFTAPFYKEPEYTNTIVHELSKDYNLPYFQYNDLALNQDKINFYDPSHLNVKGATEFSEIFAKDLNQYLVDDASTK